MNKEWSYTAQLATFATQEEVDVTLNGRLVVAHRNAVLIALTQNKVLKRLHVCDIKALQGKEEVLWDLISWLKIEELKLSRMDLKRFSFPQGLTLTALDVTASIILSKGAWEMSLPT